MKPQYWTLDRTVAPLICDCRRAFISSPQYRCFFFFFAKNRRDFFGSSRLWLMSSISHASHRFMYEHNADPHTDSECRLHSHRRFSATHLSFQLQSLKEKGKKKYILTVCCYKSNVSNNSKSVKTESSYLISTAWFESLNLDWSTTF